jgi:hypothetical protein
MQQYTTPEQTAKLIELGFEKPKGWCVEGISSRLIMYKHKEDDEGFNYSVGELLSFMPLSLENDDYYALTIRGSKVMYCDTYLDWIEVEWAKSEELIDNLFDACVELKEEGVL